MSVSSLILSLLESSVSFTRRASISCWYLRLKERKKERKKDLCQHTHHSTETQAHRHTGTQAHRHTLTTHSLHTTQSRLLCSSVPLLYSSFVSSPYTVLSFPLLLRHHKQPTNTSNQLINSLFLPFLLRLHKSQFHITSLVE